MTLGIKHGEIWKLVNKGNTEGSVVALLQSNLKFIHNETQS